MRDPTSRASRRRQACSRQPWYRNYVLGLLTICYVVNVMDRSQILAASLQSIKREFGASDFQLGLLSGIPFALFYSFLGIPIAALADRWSRRNVLASRWPSWSAHDRALRHGGELRRCCLPRGSARPSARPAAARRRTRSSPTTFPKQARHGVLDLRAGRAGRHRARRRLGGWGNQNWAGARRSSRRVCPGSCWRCSCWLTVSEPPRGWPTTVGQSAARRQGARSMPRCCAYLWRRPSFRHLSLAAALHSVVWYASGAFNNAFLQRSHRLRLRKRAYWISIFAVIAGLGTFLGGFAADRLSVRDERPALVLWVPGIATLLSCRFSSSPICRRACPMLAGFVRRA